MNQFDLAISGGHTLSFRGELVASSEVETSLSSEFVRVIKLAVYAVEEGGFVCEVRLKTTHPDEMGFSKAEHFDFFVDIDAFYYVLEIHESLCHSSVSREKLADCKARAKQLAKEYEKAVYPFLNKVQEIVESIGLPDRPQSAKKPGFWS